MPSSDRGPIMGDILITAPALRDMAPARALTYVEVTTLDRETLDELMGLYPKSAAELRQCAMKEALIKTTDLIDRAVTKKREEAHLASLSGEERQRARMAQAMTQAMSGAADGGGGGDGDGGGGGGGGGAAGGSAASDPDEVLRLICGVGGMTYRDVDADGEVVGGEDDDEALDPTPHNLMAQVRAARDDAQADAGYTHARLKSLEGALLRSTGMERRDPSFLINRPAVQRALRTCAQLSTALLVWVRQTRHAQAMRLADGSQWGRRVAGVFNRWLLASVRRMRARQLERTAMQFRVEQLFRHWLFWAACEGTAEARLRT